MLSRNVALTSALALPFSLGIGAVASELPEPPAAGKIRNRSVRGFVLVSRLFLTVAVASKSTPPATTVGLTLTPVT